MEKLFLGIDIGSTTFKAVLMNESGKVRNSLYQRTRPVDSGRVRCSGACSRCGACNFGALRQTVDHFLQDAGISGMDKIACTVVTGSQIVEDTHDFVPFDYRVSEVTAHVAGARHYYPNCKAILDVGGQDSKAMVYNDRTRMWNYKMSGICAAGTGAFLDSVAAKLNVPIEEMADRANFDSDLEFSSVCAVLSATSINKFKNRFPLGDIIGGACRAQARTVMSGVGELFLGYKGDILFQGGVSYNRAVAYYLKEITGNNIIIPEYRGVMGALGAACLAREYSGLKGTLIGVSDLPIPDRVLISSGMRAKSTRKEFLSRDKDKPMVWRNLFFPPEILNALGVRSLTLETYAALFARNQKRVKHAFDCAACKGFSGETCSFLRVLEGSELPPPACVVSTSQPCQQGERIFRDLARNYEVGEKMFSLDTPAVGGACDSNVEHVAAELERAVRLLEKSTGLKMDPARLREACELSNDAQHYAQLCNDLRYASPPLIRGGQMVYFANIFSQSWGSRDQIDMQKKLYEELQVLRDNCKIRFEDTHRLIWLHLPPFYSTALLDYIEVHCQAPIIFEEANYVGWKKLDPADPYRSLARKLLTTGFIDPALRVRMIVEESTKAQMDGCVLYNHGFGRCSMSDSSFIKHLREELNKAEIPLLVLDGDCMDTTIDPCSTETKISAFVEALNEQKFGNIFGRLQEAGK